MIWYIVLGLLGAFVICLMEAIVHYIREPYRDHSITTFGGGDKVGRQR